MSSIVKVDTIQENTSANGITVDGLNIKDSKLVTADSVVTANITDDAITLAKMASGTDGQIITYDASGNPVAVGPGTDGQVLTSTGAGSPPAFETLPSSGRLLQVIRQGWSGDVTVSSDTELISTAITPASTSSKIVAFVSVMIQPDNGEYSSLDLYRGTLSGGSKILDGGEAIFNGTGGGGRFNYNFMYIDSPSTTSATTYTVVGVPLSGASLRYGCGATNTLFLMEVSQ
nr:hypothetical protein [uncultured Mediterranean phage uvMED]